MKCPNILLFITGLRNIDSVPKTIRAVIKPEMENKLPDDPFYVPLSSIITPEFNKLPMIIVQATLRSGQKSHKSLRYQLTRTNSN